jgi:hypothetical protein
MLRPGLIPAQRTPALTWYIAELFKVENGQLRQIEAILERVPYGMLSGWSSWEDGISDRALDVTMTSLSQ